MSRHISSPVGTRISPAQGVRAVQITMLAAATGVIAGLVAYVLYYLIAVVGNWVYFQTYDPHHLPRMQYNHLGLWVILVPAVGGLIVGLMAKYGSEKIKGHGIPEAMEAVLTNKSRIAARVAILKPLSAVIAIGTGGPFGAEGPIIQTAGALGSLVGQGVRTTAGERKVLLACGASAGMAAIFGTPIAAVIISIELLLFEFKARSFIPLVVASAIATFMRHLLLGSGPLFNMHAVDFGLPGYLPYYVILGLLCGLFAVGFSKLLFWTEDQFEKLPIDALWWPAIGALMLGIIAYFVPRVLGVGYDIINAILNSQLTLGVLLLIFVFKSLALMVSLGSGTSGGLLAPMFMGGAAMGGAFAMLVNVLMPGAHLMPGAFALMGMAALFGAAARAPFTLIIFAFEITRNYDAILPLMLVCVIATGVSVLLMRNTIMTEKLGRRGLRVHQDYEVDILRQVTVAQVMDRSPETVSPSLAVSELAQRFGVGAGGNDPHWAYPVVTEDTGELIGIITRTDVLRILDSNAEEQPMTVGDACTEDLVVAYQDELVDDAASRLLHYGIRQLSVVDRAQSTRLVGQLGQAHILQALARKYQDETVREGGWWRRRRPA